MKDVGLNKYIRFFKWALFFPHQLRKPFLLSYQCGAQEKKENGIQGAFGAKSSASIWTGSFH